MHRQELFPRYKVRLIKFINYMPKKLSKKLNMPINFFTVGRPILRAKVNSLEEEEEQNESGQRTM